MNYCGHCGTRLEPNGRCPTCSAAEAALPRIVEQTAVTLPPPPPPPPTATPVAPAPASPPPVAAPTASTAVAAAASVQPAAGAEAAPSPSTAKGPAADQPTQVLTRLEPLRVQWDDEPPFEELEPLLDDPQSWRRSQLAAAGVIAVVLLLAGLGVVLWNLLAGDPDSLQTVPSVPTTAATETATSFPAPSSLPQSTLPQPGTTGPGTLPDLTPMTIAPTVPTLVPATLPATLPPVIVTVVVPRTTVAGASPRPAPVTVPATVVDATVAPDTIPPDTVPATDPPVDTTLPPEPPPQPTGGSRGSPQVLQDPLPSGLSYGEAQGSHQLAQQLADALATDDWATARALSPPLAGSSDATLSAGYGGLDRASLMLVDARAQDGGYRLLIVSVANELSGARTSLYCFEWTADPGSGTVRQGGGVGRIAQVGGTVSPEQVRNDPNLGAAVRNDCAWS